MNVPGGAGDCEGDGDGDGDGDGCGLLTAGADPATAAGSPSIVTPRHSTIVAADATVRRFMSRPPPRTYADARDGTGPLLIRRPPGHLLVFAWDIARPAGDGGRSAGDQARAPGTGRQAGLACGMVYGAGREVEQLAAGHGGWCGAMIGTMGPVAGAGAVAGGAGGRGAGGAGGGGKGGVFGVGEGGGGGGGRVGVGAGRARRAGSAAVLAGGAGRA